MEARHAKIELNKAKLFPPFSFCYWFLVIITELTFRLGLSNLCISAVMPFLLSRASAQMLIAKKNLHSCGVELCIKFDLGDCS